MIRFEPRGFENPRREENHRVDAGSLLEEVDPDGGDHDAAHGGSGAEEELFPHSFPVAVPPRDLDDVVVAVRGDPGGFFDVFEAEGSFGGGIGGFVEDAFGFAEAALHDEPPRRFGHGEDADGEYDGRYGSDAEHESPAELQREL